MNQKILDKTIEIARAAYPSDFNGRRCFHITALWDKNRLISIGENNLRTHPRNARNNVNKFDLGMKKSCSELQAVLRAKNKISDINWRKLSMVNCRINFAGDLCMARPCCFCRSMLEFFRCKSVYFTNDSGEFEEYC